MTPTSVPRRRLGAALVLGAALTVAACSGGGESAPTTLATTTTTTTTTTSTTTTSTTTTSTTVAPTTTTAPDVPRQPLTGIPVESVDDLDPRPALAVKIDNADVARQNHTGLAVADIVWEEIVEDSNTRYAAVFHSQDADPVGPIRSGRSQDVAILTPLNRPLFAWSGGNPGVTRLIESSFLTDLNWQKNARSYYRGPGSAPNNLYSSTQTLYGLTPADHPGAPPQQFAYVVDDEEFSGEPATSVEVEMRRRDIGWEWNAGEGAYERLLDGTPHVDVNYGRIRAQNVIVMVVEYRPSQIDAKSPEAQTLGNGPVYVFSNGQVIVGRWSRELEVNRFLLTDERGETIKLTPGQTWIELAEARPSGDPANPDVDLTWS